MTRGKRVYVVCGIALIAAMLAWDFIDGFAAQLSIKAGLVGLGAGILWFLLYCGWALPKGKDDDGPTVI